MNTLFGYSFTNKLLGEAALRHPSLPGRLPAGYEHFERLEFLGDRVLGLTIATWLMQHFPNEAEGPLTRRHTALVRAETLAAIAEETELSKQIKLASSEGSTIKANILADAVEAVLGAVYLDGGLGAAEAIIKRLWASRIEGEPQGQRDSKTRLQEWTQSRGPHLPHYEMLGQSGPPHAPQFKVRVTVPDGRSAEGTGSNKRTAEQLAAAALLAKVDQ